MAYTNHLLVVANRTVDSPELLDALDHRAERGPIHVTLLAPTSWSERGSAKRRLDGAVACLRAGGMEAVGLLGDEDPIVAVGETWDPGRFDEVVVSTLAAPASRWMQADLPHRVAKLTDCPVLHIETPIARPAPSRAPMRPASTPGLLPSVLALMRAQTRRSDARARA